MSVPSARDEPSSDATLAIGPPDGAGTLELTAQQVIADQRQSWLHGRRVPVEDYLAWIPTLADNPAAVVDLIVHEFLLREELGERPTAADFLTRFPQYSDGLKRKFRADPGEHDTIPSDDRPLCLDSEMTVQTANLRGNDPTQVEEQPEGPAHGSTNVEDPPPEPLGSTHVEDPPADSSDATAIEFGSESPLRSQTNPTSIIEATEAMARELAEREGIGRELTPERAKLVERLKRALQSPGAPAARLTPGRTVPGYEIIDELGRGAVGVVYRARQLALNRVVALKMVLVGAHASRTMLNRFKAEAEAVASLQHGNIVQIHDIGEHDGLPYFSLEYCAGGSLADRLDGTPLDPQTAARIVEKLCRGMHYAHGCKVVHRDLKPGNVLLHPRDDAGRPVEPQPGDGDFDFQSVIYKVSDFGLAKRIDEASHTRTGAILGTPSYMSPEQASGRTRDVGPSSDIYALGAILYELLTGRPPFRAATPLDTVVQVINDEPVAPTRLHSGVPADLETIALKCLQKDAAKRYATAADLADDLQRYLNSEPILARPIGSIERAARWCRRNPVVAGLTGLAATLLIAGTVVSSYYAHRANRESKQSRENELAAIAASERAQRNSFVAQMNLVQRAWRDVEMTRVRALLDEQIPKTDGALDFRGFEWSYWNRLANAEQAVFRNPVGAKPSIAYSPDGRLLAVGGKGVPIRIREIASGREVGSTAVQTEVVAGLAFLPDGRLVSVSTSYDGNVLQGGEVRIWAAADFRLVKAFAVASAEVDRAALSHDGARIAMACRDGEVIVVGLDGVIVHRLDSPRRADGAGAAAVAVAMSADGRLVAAGYDNGTAIVQELAQAKRWTLPARSGTAAYSVAFSPDGRRLAVGRGVVRQDLRTYDSVGDVLLWEFAGESAPSAMIGHLGSVLSVQFNRDGRRLVSAGNDRTIRVWDTKSGQSTAVLQGHERAVNSVDLSPDGRCIASVSEDGTTRLWGFDTNDDLELAADEKQPSTSIAVSPDGRYLAVGCKDAGDRPSVVSIFDLITHQPVATVPGGRTVNAIAFSPDGRRLALAMAGDDRSSIRIWSLTDRRAVREFVAEIPRVNRLAFAAPDGRLYVAGGDRILAFAGDDAEQSGVFHSPAGNIVGLAVAENGDVRAISVDRNRAIIWDSRSGAEPRELAGHVDGIASAALSADGRYAVTGGGDRVALVWDAATGVTLTRLTGHVGTVAAACFSPDGSRIATVGEEFDRTTRLWDRVSGQELLVLESAPGQNSQVTFDRSGERLAVLRGGIRVWDGRPIGPGYEADRAALAAARFHMAQSRDRAASRAAIALDPALGPAVRRAALLYADDWPDPPPMK